MWVGLGAGVEEESWNVTRQLVPGENSMFKGLEQRGSIVGIET